MGETRPRPRYPIGRLRRRLGIRLRSALAAASVVAVALAVAAVAVVVIMQTTLTRGVDGAVTQRANEVAAAVATGDSARIGLAVRPAPGEETVVQVVAAAGTVVATSPELDGEPP